ncbi:matrixin family metalloprotease [Arthrobacter sp. SDTb3-6]|uniref:matrixin family metalloprotease n=1 Tax=Arthrobacter sp. SDTb3-6 TaxID=2713571 RepID=UPI00159DFE9B|nr:matrixin family metalloprotease [Arthrobacter sp. SDTb3-6]
MRKKPRRHHGRFRRILPAACSVLALAMIVSYYAFPGLVGQATAAIAGEQFHAPQSGVGPASSWTAGYPPRGVEAHKAPLGRPAAVAQTSESYAFIGGDSRSGLIAYDPCRPIHFVTRPDNAPEGGRELITRAVAAASQATGLVFIDDGGTTEGYSTNRGPYQPGRYGKRWAPVLFVWATAAEQPKFVQVPVPGETNVAGLGGSQAIVGDTGSEVFVTGTVQLNAGALGETMSRPGGPALVQAVIEHEIGHVLGLGHVKDPSQLMYDRARPGVTTYAAGDLTGLARLGQGKCFPNH